MNISTSKTTILKLDEKEAITMEEVLIEFRNALPSHDSQTQEQKRYIKLIDSILTPLTKENARL